MPLVQTAVPFGIRIVSPSTASLTFACTWANDALCAMSAHVGGGPPPPTGFGGPMYSVA